MTCAQWPPICLLGKLSLAHIRQFENHKNVQLGFTPTGQRDMLFLFPVWQDLGSIAHSVLLSSSEKPWFTHSPSQWGTWSWAQRPRWHPAKTWFHRIVIWLDLEMRGLHREIKTVVAALLGSMITSLFPHFSTRNTYCYLQPTESEMMPGEPFSCAVLCSWKSVSQASAQTILCRLCKAYVQHPWVNSRPSLPFVCDSVYVNGRIGLWSLLI